MAGSEAGGAWPKPLDVGNGQVCASFAVDGSWLSLGRPHPGRGFVELTGAPPFDEILRGRPDAVRRYRRQLALAGNAALRLTGAPSEVAPDPGRPGRARWSAADRAASYQAEAWAAAGQPAVTQRHLWRAGPDRRPRRLVLVVPGRLQRPSFAEITEVSPLPPCPRWPRPPPRGPSCGFATGPSRRWPGWTSPWPAGPPRDGGSTPTRPGSPSPGTRVGNRPSRSP